VGNLPWLDNTVSLMNVSALVWMDSWLCKAVATTGLAMTVSIDVHPHSKFFSFIFCTCASWVLLCITATIVPIHGIPVMGPDL